jgi:hypothetical protein
MHGPDAARPSPFEARFAGASEHVNLFAIREITVAAGVCIVIP